MTNKTLRSAVVIVLLCGGLAWGTLFTWSDLGGDTQWRTEENWTVVPVCGGTVCYPSTTSDDAVICVDNVTVTLAASETIDDLTVCATDDGDVTTLEDDNYGPDATR